MPHFSEVEAATLPGNTYAICLSPFQAAADTWSREDAFGRGSTRTCETGLSSKTGLVAETSKHKHRGEAGTQDAVDTEPDTWEVSEEDNTPMFEFRLQVANLIDAALAAQQASMNIDYDGEWEEQEAECWVDVESTIGSDKGVSMMSLDVESNQAVERQLPHTNDVGPCSRCDVPRILQPTTRNTAPAVREVFSADFVSSASQVMAPTKELSPQEQAQLRLSYSKDQLFHVSGDVAHVCNYKKAHQEACRIIQVHYRQRIAARAVERSQRGLPRLPPDVCAPVILLDATPPETIASIAPLGTASMQLPVPERGPKVDNAVAERSATVPVALLAPLPALHTSALRNKSMGCAANPRLPQSNMPMYGHRHSTLQSSQSSSSPRYSDHSATRTASLCKASGKPFDRGRENLMLPKGRPKSPRNQTAVAPSSNLMGMPGSSLLRPAPEGGCNVPQRPALTAMEEDLGLSGIVLRTEVNSFLPKLSMKALGGATIGAASWATDRSSSALGGGSLSARGSNKMSIDAAVPGLLSARLSGLPGRAMSVM